MRLWGTRFRSQEKSVADIVAGVNALASVAPPAPSAPTAEPKRGAGRPPKAGKTAAEMAAEMGLSTPAPAAPAPVQAIASFSEEQIRAKLSELMAHRTGDADEMAGMVRVQTVLAKVGVQQIKALDPSKYAELVKYIDAA